MGLPSQKRTKSSKKRRASHFALPKITLGKCPKCLKPVLPHHACSFCGTYAGKEVLKMKFKKGKKKEKKEYGQ
jgi:large subunit ribosomal protein L32